MRKSNHLLTLFAALGLVLVAGSAEPESSSATLDEPQADEAALVEALVDGVRANYAFGRGQGGQLHTG